MPATELLNKFINLIINPLIVVVFAAGFFMFVFGLVQFLFALNKGQSENEEGKQHMLWGVVGMFVMASVYGILTLLNNTFGLDMFSATPDVSRMPDINLPYFQ